MTEFAKMKISFALALLGTLFALHPFLDRYAEVGFLYLGYDLKVYYAYALVAGLLSLCVYSYALALTKEHPHARLERLGNSCYSLAVMIVPIYAGLYLASVLAGTFRYSHIAWAAPAAAVGFGGFWFLLTQLIALRFRAHLGEQDRLAKIDQLRKQEVASLSQANELFAGDHFDLCVIEALRAIVARLRQVLLSRRISCRSDEPHAIFDAATRKGIIREPVLSVLQDLRRHWNVAVSTEPLTRQAAIEALSAARHILATVPVDDPAEQPIPTL